MASRAKKISKIKTMQAGNIILPEIFNKYYSWLTSRSNFNKTINGMLVKHFRFLQSDEVDFNIESSKEKYVQLLESIAYGIIKSITNSDALNFPEYIEYQANALRKILGNTPCIRSQEMMETYEKMFKVQDLDGDGKLNIRELTVALAYLDLQDGKLTGCFQYKDAVRFGRSLNTEVGRINMKIELNDLKKLLYEC